MKILILILCTLIATTGAVFAQGTLGDEGGVVTLPDESQTTWFTATVSEQADVSVPAEVTFTIIDVSADTESEEQSVSATTVVLGNGKKLRIEIAPDAVAFTPPAGGTVTWASNDISWVGTWTNGTANNATMSAVADTYVKLVDMTAANSGSLVSEDLVFTLGDKSTVDRAGDHTLSATWKFSSL